LRCMRRIKQLENCSGGLGDMPYVLLTAWREVKSCLEILARQDPQNHPVFTMILCEVKGQSRRVCRWAESWPAHATFPVYVCQHLSCPTTLVYDMLDKLILHKRNTVQRPPLPIGHCDGHSVQHVSGQDTATAEGPPTDAPPADSLPTRLKLQGRRSCTELRLQEVTPPEAEEEELRLQEVTSPEDMTTAESPMYVYRQG